MEIGDQNYFKLIFGISHFIFLKIMIIILGNISWINSFHPTHTHFDITNLSLNTKQFYKFNFYQHAQHVTYTTFTSSGVSVTRKAPMHHFAIRSERNLSRLQKHGIVRKWFTGTEYVRIIKK